MADEDVRWVYTAVDLHGERGTMLLLEDQVGLLDAAGEEGWELVAVYAGVAYFKRHTLGPVLD